MKRRTFLHGLIGGALAWLMPWKAKPTLIESVPVEPGPFIFGVDAATGPDRAVFVMARRSGKTLLAEQYYWGESLMDRPWVQRAQRQQSELLSRIVDDVYGRNGGYEGTSERIEGRLRDAEDGG